MKKRWLLALAAILVIAVCGTQALPVKNPTVVSEPQHAIAAQQVITSKTDAFPALGRPEALRIPSLGITSTIHPVGKTPEGAMDIPDSLTDTGWYEQSVNPGSPGKAVLAAHTGFPDKPNSFANSKKSNRMILYKLRTRPV